LGELSKQILLSPIRLHAHRKEEKLALPSNSAPQRNAVQALAQTEDLAAAAGYDGAPR
jgi:hypothetical protein